MRQNVIDIPQFRLIAIIGFAAVLLLFCSVQDSVANDTDQFTARQLKGLAKSALMYKDNYSAIEYYEALLKRKKEDAGSMYNLAECYRKVRDYENALKWYKKAYKTDEKKHLVAQYYWASMLMVQKDYNEAEELFSKFKKSSQGDKKLKPYNNLARTQIKACRFAKRDSGTVVWMDIVDNSINKPSAELSPILIDANTMVYASLRTDSTLYEYELDEKTELPVRQFYVAKRDGNNWQYQSAWDNVPFNQKGINTGNGALSPDGKRFYFTRCQPNWKNTTICKIYRSEKDKAGNWSEPKLLPDFINSDNYTTTQPAVARHSKSKDEILYFVTDRPGGKGGYDIWYTRYRQRKEEWKAPRNCGGKINSIANEVTPFIEMENSTMYFSSDGGEGLGQLDIYKSVGEQSKWLPPENIKAPVNSSYDDFYYSIGKNLTEGFFASNRPGGNSQLHTGCCDDLYTFKYDEIIRITATGSIYARVDRSYQMLFETGDTVKGETIRVDSSFQLAEGVPVTLFIIDETAPYGGGNMIFVKRDSLDENGRFSFNLDAGREYVIDVENYGYFNQKYNISTILYTQSDTMQLDTVGIDRMPTENIVISNLYYESGKSELTRKARKTLDNTLLRILKENPKIIIEISSHTDSKGRDKANMELSQKRADGVRRYLLKQGIDKERLYARGYGETSPKADNDTDEGRQMNRRTEFKIIGSLDQYTELEY